MKAFDEQEYQSIKENEARQDEQFVKQHLAAFKAYIAAAEPSPCLQVRAFT